jgi:hypothetical protein
MVIVAQKPANGKAMRRHDSNRTGRLRMKRMTASLKKCLSGGKNIYTKFLMIVIQIWHILGIFAVIFFIYYRNGTR